MLFWDSAGGELGRRPPGRRVCRHCQANYHVIFAQPRIEGKCDKCGSELYQRDDDREETVRKRLSVYQEQTAPLLEYYRGRSLLTTVDAAKPVEAVFETITRALEGS